MGTVPTRPIRRLLIVKMSSIGDVAHALPIVAKMRQTQPNLFIGWVVKRRCAELLRGNPNIDRLYVISDKFGLGDIARLRSELLADRYDTAFDMQGLLTSGLVSLISGAPRRIGLDRNREGNKLFLTEPVVKGREPDRHAVDILAGFLEMLGQDPSPSTEPQKYLVEADGAFATEILRGLSKPIVGLNIGASTIYKRWPLPYWVEVAQWVASQKGTLILLGGTGDVAEAGQVAEAIRDPSKYRNLAGKTNLRQLAAIMARCDVLVSGDTGPLHVAVLVGVPTVSLYGPTSPRRTGPYGDRNLVIYKALECSPCNRNPTCSGRVDCMTQISPDEVIDAIVTSLKKSGVAR